MRDLLLKRLDAIARSIAACPTGLALLGLGSCGDFARLDDHSDLDFFVIVEAGSASQWREHLDWLDAAGPIAFAHRNTVDGWKVLYADGVLCEFAVFEPQQLAGIPFSPGQLVWSREGFDSNLVVPQNHPSSPDPAWHAREALTNLLVGLKRLNRGEVLSAWQSICVHAVSNVVRAVPSGTGDDVFDGLRRIEQRAPDLATDLTRVVLPTADDDKAALQQSALSLLAMLERVCLADLAIAETIRREAGYSVA